MAYEQILVRITGKDRIGLTAAFMEILARHDAQVLDIGQADIHSTLSLGILFRIDEKYSGQVMKDLLFKTSELGVQIGFQPIPDDEYEDWAGRQGRMRYILTVIGRSLSAAQIEAAAKIIAEQGLDIDSIKRLTGRLSIAHPARNVRSCIEFSLRGVPKDRKAMQKDLMHLSAEMGMDFSFQHDDMYRRMRRLICPSSRPNASTNSPSATASETRSGPSRNPPCAGKSTSRRASRVVSPCLKAWMSA